MTEGVHAFTASSTRTCCSVCMLLLCPQCFTYYCTCTCTIIQHLVPLYCSMFHCLLQLVDVFLIHEDLNLVFEFCETDLESILMEQSVVLKPEHIKCHMRMLLEGIGFLHKNFVLHRVSERALTCEVS